MKRKSRNIRNTVMHPVTFSPLVFYIIVRAHTQKELNSSTNYTTVQCWKRFHVFSIPLQVQVANTRAEQ